MADDVTKALAGSANQGRVPQGNDGFAVSPSAPLTGTLVPKGNHASGEPAGSGAGSRSPIMQDQLGASYRIVPHTDRGVQDPSAGATLANSRIVKSAIDRDRTNFFMAVGGI